MKQFLEFWFAVSLLPVRSKSRKPVAEEPTSEQKFDFRIGVSENPDLKEFYRVGQGRIC